jgi:hypothetical protein
LKCIGVDAALSLLQSLALSPSGSVPEQELVISSLLTLFLDPELRRSLASSVPIHVSASVSR